MLNMGELPEGFDPSQIPGGFGGMFPGESSNGAENTPTDNSDNNDSTGTGNRPSRDNMQMPGGDFNFNIWDIGDYYESIEISEDILINRLVETYPNNLSQWAGNGLIPVSSPGIINKDSYFFCVFS